ncbi:hypothetical protein EON62_03420, partial [archaeon]
YLHVLSPVQVNVWESAEEQAAAAARAVGDGYGGIVLRPACDGAPAIVHRPYTDGSVYEGGSERGRRCGYGKYTRVKRGVGAAGGDAAAAGTGDDDTDDDALLGTLRDDTILEYEGMWADDQPHGNGTARYADGAVYVGDFVACRRVGFGTLTWPDESTPLAAPPVMTVSVSQEALKPAAGAATSLTSPLPSRGRRRSSASDGKRGGAGGRATSAVAMVDVPATSEAVAPLTTPAAEPVRYEPPLWLRWVTAPPSGSATLLDTLTQRCELLPSAATGTSSSRISKVEGTFKDGEPSGEVRVSYAHGGVYEGSWCRGVPHGVGVYTYTSAINSVPVVQSFANMALNGDASSSKLESSRAGGSGCTVTEGDAASQARVYVAGEWQHGQLHGATCTWRGTLAYGLLDEYVGGYVLGIREGHGTWRRDAEGTTYTGTFRAGLPNGDGVKRYADLTVYDGKFRQGLRCGRGTLVYANGDILVGMWADDLTNGVGRLRRRASGMEVECVYERGVLVSQTVVRQ